MDYNDIEIKYTVYGHMNSVNTLWIVQRDGRGSYEVVNVFQKLNF